MKSAVLAVGRKKIKNKKPPAGSVDCIPQVSLQNSMQVARELFQEQGLRWTQPRQSLVELLAVSQKSWSPKQIFVELNRVQKTIDQVSVYRVLEQLSKMGLVHEMEDGRVRYCGHVACKASHHIFVDCVTCGSQQEHHLPESELQSLFAGVQQRAGFTILDAKITMSGTCQKCLKARST